MVIRLTNLPLALHGGATLVAFGLFQAAKGWLDASYAASGYPVDYATGQLAFSAARIESYYAAMAQGGTLDVYLRTQVIDFSFIASVMLLALLLGTLVARLGGWARGLGLAASVLGIAGAGFDVLENLLSFVLLSDPDDIAQGWALAYSSAAAVKFALLTGAMGAVVLAFVAGVARHVGRLLSTQTA